MRKFRTLVILFLFVVGAALVTSSCFNLEKVKHFRYEITFESEQGAETGFLEVSSVTEGEKSQLKVQFALAGKELSTSFDITEGDVSSALFPLMMSNPELAAVMTPLGTVQGLVMVLSMAGPLKVGFEMKEEDDQGRMTEVRIPSSETRFGKEAVWVESYVDGKLAFKVLVEQETFFPLVVDFRDPEMLEEKQTRGYFEITEITWKEEL